MRFTEALGFRSNPTDFYVDTYNRSGSERKFAGREGNRLNELRTKQRWDTRT